MRYLLACTVKDLRRYLRDPMGLVIAIAIPLVIGTLITAATGGQGGPKPKARLLLVDEDDSFVSGLLRSALGGADEFVDLQNVDREEGERRIHDGDGSALLVIPEGFGDAFLREQDCELVLFKNPSQTILPGIVEEGVSILVDGHFYLHRVLGEELQSLIDMGEQEGGVLDPDIARLSVSMNQVVRRVEQYLFPPVIEFETGVDDPDEDGEAGPTGDPDEGGATEGGDGAVVDAPVEEPKPKRRLTLGLLLLPGILMMALLFTSQGISEDVWTERENGTLSRALTGPAHLAGFIAGKLLAGTLMLSCTMLVGIFAGTLYFDLSFALLPLAVFWASWIGLLILLAMTMTQLYVSSRRAGSMILGSVVFPMMMLGGSLLPIETFPDWMARIGAVTPSGWATEHLKDIFLERFDAASLAQGFGLSAAVAVLLVFFTARRVRALGGRR